MPRSALEHLPKAVVAAQSENERALTGEVPSYSWLKCAWKGPRHGDKRSGSRVQTLALYTGTRVHGVKGVLRRMYVAHQTRALCSRRGRASLNSDRPTSVPSARRGSAPRSATCSVYGKCKFRGGGLTFN